MSCVRENPRMRRPRCPIISEPSRPHPLPHVSRLARHLFARARAKNPQESRANAKHRFCPPEYPARHTFLREARKELPRRFSAKDYIPVMFPRVKLRQSCATSKNYSTISLHEDQLLANIPQRELAYMTGCRHRDAW